jgi:hypothetical protein
MKVVHRKGEMEIETISELTRIMSLMCKNQIKARNLVPNEDEVMGGISTYHIDADEEGEEADDIARGEDDGRVGAKEP